VIALGRRIGAQYLVALAASGLAAYGQPIRTGTELVTIPVTVTNRGRSEQIRGLSIGDFRVLEDNIEQQIVTFTRERVPLSLCIVLDSSYSMKGMPQRLASEAIDKLIAGLDANDEVALAIFADHVELRVPWTRAAEFPVFDWTQWKAVSSTALIDGLREALDLMNGARHAQSVVLLVSDGIENASKTSFRDIVRTRRQSEVRVYGFRTEGRASTLPPLPSLPGRAAPIDLAPPNILPLLVGDSGGWSYPVANAVEAGRALAAFLDELGSLYLLGYTPTRPLTGGYRTITVEVRSGKFRVRHRRGYVALPVR
jgi:Ca-activated chloride channel family protein